MSIAQSIKSQVIEPLDRQRFDLIAGQVMSYDEETNTATICYNDAKSGGIMTQERVPVELSGLGVIPAAPFPGDQVYLSFMNGNQLKPKVIAMADEAYVNYTRPLTKHGRKGAFLTDYLSSVSSFIGGLFQSEDGGAVQDDWIDDTSSKTTYQGYQQYSTDKFTEKGENWSYYRSAEVGFTHPLNSSTLKIRDNGVVESFASTNCGWRIDPNTHSINFISSKELHNATSATHLIDRQLRFEVGRQLYIKTPATLINAEKQTITSDNVILKTDRLRTAGKDVRLKTDEWQVQSAQTQLNLGESKITTDDMNLKSSLMTLLLKDLSLSTNSIETDAQSIVLNSSDVQLNATNVTIEGHIEADIAHLIERWMNQNFGGYFDKAIGQREIVKLMDR